MADDPNQKNDEDLGNGDGWLDRISSFELPESIKKNAITAFAKGVGKVVTATVDVPAAWLEGVAENIRAESSAKAAVTKAAGESAAELLKRDPLLAERALARLSDDIYQQQIRREAIALKTIEELECQASDFHEEASIDDDWLTMFWSLAETKSNEEIQSYFAKLLAQEIASPGQISPYTLQVLSVLTGDIAHSFERLCSLSIYDGEQAYVIHPHVYAFQGIGPLHDYEVSYDDLFDLESGGLIRSAETIMLNYAKQEDAVLEEVDYAGAPALLRLSGHQVKLIQFTKAGKELRGLVPMSRCSKYTEALKEKFKEDFESEAT